MKDFEPSKILLSLYLIDKMRGQIINEEKIQEIIHNYTKDSEHLAQEIYYDIILKNNLKNETIYSYFYKQYKMIDFTYNIYQTPIETTIFMKEREMERERESKRVNDENNQRNQKLQEINDLFYEGFGFDLL